MKKDKKLVNAKCYAVVRDGRVIQVTSNEGQALLWAAWNSRNAVIAGTFVPLAKGRKS